MRRSRWAAALGLSALTLAALDGCSAATDEAGVATGEDLGMIEHPLGAPVTVTFQNGVAPSASYSGSTDSTIRQASPTANAGSATTCEADGDDGSGVDKSCLLRWNLSGIPSGSVVQSVSVVLRVVNGTGNTYNVYALSRDWTESAVTWQRATASITWQTAGALGASDRGAVVGTVTGATGSRTLTLNTAGVAAVQSWVDGGSTAGLVIASTSNTDGIDVASSEHGTTSYHPALRITYAPPDGGGGTGGATGTGGVTSTGGTPGTGGASGGETEPDLLVAFIGDQGDNGNSDSVLNLIRNEGAVATVHNGDFDYGNNPAAWNARIDAILGANYPYFAVIGNHDAAAWNGGSGYGSYIAAREARVASMNCTGEPGVKSTCNFRGLHLVQSCVGTSELRSTCGKDAADQVNFIRDTLATDQSIWSICSWHKNQNDMQVGTKRDEVGWNAYKECMKAGAIVSTGHEHSYARTRALTDLGNRAAGHGFTGLFDTVQLGANRTFVFVSGLGGSSVRAYDAGAHNDDTWWASYITNDRWLKNGVLQSGGGTYGALFVRFHVDGNPKKARAYFKDLSGRLVDEFTILAP